MLQSVVRASSILAVLVGVLSALVYAAGLHENFMLSQVLFLGAAIAINVAVVVWSLSRSASTNTYGQQILQSAGIGLLGGILVTAVSWLLLAVVFPNALDELRQGAVIFMEESGMPQEQVDEQMASLTAATPMSQSIPGGVGTFFTSLVCGAVVAIWARRKSAA